MRIRFLLIASSILIFQTVGAALYLEDHFPYTNGNLGAVGVSGGWSGSASGITVTSNSLDGSALGLAASSGNKVTTTTAGGSTYNQFSSGIVTGTVYVSFLLRIDSSTGISSSGQVIVDTLKAGSESSYYGDIYLQLNGSDVQIGLAKLRGTPTWYGTPLVVGNTYLIVMKYQFVSGSANDVVSLWVNPASLGGTEPSADVSFSSGGDGNNSVGLGRCYIYGGASADIDELRAGSTWADVTPIGEVVPPTTAPYVTQAQMSLDGLILQGTNGPAGGQYVLLTTTNVALPLAQWSVITTNSFDSSGNFNCTNPVTSGVAEQFYRLWVGEGTSSVPLAPIITTQPQDQTVMVGQGVFFTVEASGTAPLSYQWYFNTNTVLTNATDAVLSLTNPQPADAGGYSVIVTNNVGSVTSVVAMLTVTNIIAPPSITTQPENQNAMAGGTATFTVAATGSTPLNYQWYFNTNTPLADATNAMLVLGNVGTNDAGGYSVVVTNYLGSITSVVAFLIVSSNMPNFDQVGFANYNFNVTGAGSNAPSVIVTTGADLEKYSDQNSNIIIYVSGTLQISGMSTHVRNNKTVIGMGTDATLVGGGLYLYNFTNVIIRNLTIVGSTDDDIGIHYSHNIWIDHCTLVDASDGSIDITQQSDDVTISWCKFYYTTNHGHDFVNLVGASDEDTSDLGKLHVTFHHNWWSTNCVERMPSDRFGQVHCYNNYYSAPGNDYCVRSRLYAECLVENNYFENVRNPWEVYITSPSPPLGKIWATNNNVGFLDTSYGVSWGGTVTNKDGTIDVMVPGTDAVFTPPYSYSLDPVSQVPNLVTNYAGAGKGPFAP